MYLIDIYIYVFEACVRNIFLKKRVCLKTRIKRTPL